MLSRTASFLLTLDSVLHALLSAVQPTFVLAPALTLDLDTRSSSIFCSSIDAASDFHQSSPKFLRVTLTVDKTSAKNSQAVNPICHSNFWTQNKNKNLLAEMKIKPQCCHRMGTTKKLPNMSSSVTFTSSRKQEMEGVSYLLNRLDGKSYIILVFLAFCKRGRRRT